MKKYEIPEMQVMYFEENIRTDVVNISTPNIEPGDNNVDVIYPF